MISWKAMGPVCLLITSSQVHGAIPPADSLVAHSTFITVVTCSPTKKWLGTGDSAGTFFIWNLTTKRISMSLGTRRSRVIAAAFNRTGTQCAVSYEDGTLIIAEMATQHLERHRTDQPIVGMRFSREDQLQLVELHAVTSYSYSKRRRTSLARYPELTASLVAFSTDGSLLAIATNDSQVKVLHLPGKKIVGRLPAMDHPIMGLAFDESRATLTCGLLNGEIQVWDWKSKNMIRKAQVNDMIGITCLACNPKGGIVAAGTLSDMLQIYTIRDKRFVQLLPVRGPVSALCFSPDGKLLYAGYGNRVRSDPLDGIVDILEVPGRR